MSGGPIMEKQRNYAYSLLKNGGYSTYNVRTLERDAEDMPHIDLGDSNESVWNWLAMLDVDEASEVITWLQEHQ